MVCSVAPVRAYLRWVHFSDHPGFDGPGYESLGFEGHRLKHYPSNVLYNLLSVPVSKTLS